MAKITIEELYRGEKYDIMSAVAVKVMISALTSAPKKDGCGSRWSSSVRT